MNRLDTICSEISENSIVCDVGCDHAYLLLKAYDKIKKGYAFDIAKKPLLCAQKTISENNLQDKISTTLSNGLEKLTFEMADTIVIAGMGGELICDILQNCDFICHDKFTLLLQPMSKTPELRQFLYKNGFKIEKELISKEERRYYTIIKARYASIYQDLSYYDCLVSKSLKKQPLFNNYINYLIDKNQLILKNIETSNDTQKINFIKQTLTQLKEALND